LLIISDLPPQSNHDLICGHPYGSDPQKFAPAEIGNLDPAAQLLDANQPAQALVLLKILIVQLKDIINTDSQIETIKRPSLM
jgi:hypothetical protein